MKEILQFEGYSSINFYCRAEVGLIQYRALDEWYWKEDLGMYKLVYFFE